LIWIAAILIASTDFHGDVLGAQPFCTKLIENLAGSGVTQLAPKHLAAVLPELVRDDHKLVVGDAFRNHDFQIAELFEMWLRKESASKPEPWVKDKRQLKALFNRFVKEQDKTFRKILPRLVDQLPELVRLKTKSILQSEFREIQGDRFEFLRLLEDRKSSRTHLARRGDEFVMVRQYLGDRDHFELQRKIAEFLSDQNIPMAKPLGVDADQQSLILSFAEGFSIEDVQDLVDREILPLEALEAFGFQHARFYNLEMSRLRVPYLSLFGPGPVAIDPNLSRVLFNPAKESWIVIDPN